VHHLHLESGDIVVWCGPARFVYHGVAPLKDGEHPLTAPRASISPSEKYFNVVCIRTLTRSGEHRDAII
jgi:hypothetical protein